MNKSTPIDEPNLDDILRRIAYWNGYDTAGEWERTGHEAKAQVEDYIAAQTKEAYRKGYNDNARDCYCDSTKLIESLIPHKHLLDDDKIHNIRPNLPKGDDK